MPSGAVPRNLSGGRHRLIKVRKTWPCGKALQLKIIFLSFSRYFVICIQDSGRKAYIGIGFADRADSFDLNVTLQDHFKWLKKEDAFSKEAEEPDKPSLDLAFKEGQTIRINIPKKQQQQQQQQQGQGRRTAGGGGSGGGILPPPPGGVKLGPPPGTANLTPMQSPSAENNPVTVAAATTNPSSSSNVDLLGDLLGGGSGSAPTSRAAPSTNHSAEDDLWGDFASSNNQAQPSGNWVQF